MARKSEVAGILELTKKDIAKMREKLWVTKKHFHTVRQAGLGYTGDKFIEYAEEECPKNTTQLSKCIGKFRVEPHVLEEADLEYGYHAEPHNAIWRRGDSGGQQKSMWLDVGTNLDYAQPVNARSMFMLRAAFRTGYEMANIMRAAMKDHLRKRGAIGRGRTPRRRRR